MSALTTLLTTVALASGLATAPVEAGPYRQDRMVEAMTADRIVDLFHQVSPMVREERTNYLAGFTLWYDSNCDFLPMATFESIRRMVKAANRSGSQQAAAAVEAGHQDARVFLGEKGCTGDEARTVRGALGRFWDGDASPRERQGNVVQAYDSARF